LLLEPGLQADQAPAPLLVVQGDAPGNPVQPEAVVRRRRYRILFTQRDDKDLSCQVGCRRGIRVGVSQDIGEDLFVAAPLQSFKVVFASVGGIRTGHGRCQDCVSCLYMVREGLNLSAPQDHCPHNSDPAAADTPFHQVNELTSRPGLVALSPIAADAENRQRGWRSGIRATVSSGMARDARVLMEQIAARVRVLGVQRIG
jgi:hypothetical protein